jgi:hypothetical protein
VAACGFRLRGTPCFSSPLRSLPTHLALPFSSQQAIIECAVASRIFRIRAMVRYALAIYLMATTAVGPWFCCCLPARVDSACCRGLARAQSTPEHVSSCCRHQSCCEPEATRARDGKTQEPLECPYHRPCACKEQLISIASNTSHEFDAIKKLGERSLLHGPLELLGLEIAFHPSATGDSSPRQTVLPSTTTTARDILRASHILRC